MQKIVSILLSLLFLSNCVLGQDPAESHQVEMADALRSDGKIYVVVLVVMIVFTFFLLYLLLTDRQVKKVEKEIESLKNSK